MSVCDRTLRAGVREVRLACSTRGDATCSTGRAKQSRHLICGKREQVLTQASFGVANPTTRMGCSLGWRELQGHGARAREPEEDRNQLRHLHSIGVHEASPKASGALRTCGDFTRVRRHSVCGPALDRLAFMASWRRRSCLLGLRDGCRCRADEREGGAATGLQQRNAGAARRVTDGMEITPQEGEHQWPQ